jgi:N-acetyl-gamma-glutamyl-phosphate reductase
MMRVGIVGASGYTGVELARLLAGHPEIRLTVATSRQYAGKPLAEVFPNLRKRVDILCENLSWRNLSTGQTFFSPPCPIKPPWISSPSCLAAGKKVVDLSADYRLHNAAVYEAWYQKHTSPELLAEAVYGLPELYREQIADARLTANPGCYPTSVILALHAVAAPADRSRHPDHRFQVRNIGRRRAANVGTLFCEVSDGFKPYKVGGTIATFQRLNRNSPWLQATGYRFIHPASAPHIPRDPEHHLRFAHPEGKAADLQALYEQTYQDEPFVRGSCPPAFLPPPSMSADRTAVTFHCKRCSNRSIDRHVGH